MPLWGGHLQSTCLAFQSARRSFVKHKVAFDSLDRIDITMLMAMGIPWGDADVILHTYNRLVHQSRENFDGGAAAGVANANNLKAAAPRNSMTKRGMSMVVR